MKLLALLAFLALADPGPSRLAVDLAAAPSTPAGAIELRVVDPQDDSEVLRFPARFPFKGNVDLPSRAAGRRLEIVSEEYWAAPRPIPDVPQPSVALEIFSRGKIVFREDIAATGEATPQQEETTLEVSSVPVPREKEKLQKTQLVCSRHGAEFHCPAPALALDLRLAKTGHIPRYVFGAKVEPGKTLDLGKIRFAKGASISGFVTVEEGEPKGAEVAVRVSGRVSPVEGQRQELRKLTSTANERGFFQVLGVAPGGYRIEASRQGLMKNELWPVDVLADRETVLSEPLHLTRAAEIELHLSPPFGPVGRPWKVTLIQVRLDGDTETFEGETGAGGVWRRPDLSPGSYMIHVANPDGEKTGAGDDSIWAMQTLDLVPGHQPYYIDVPTIEVEGTFRAGDEPLQGRLIFGGYHGAPHVTLRSDAEGRFAGQLPRKGAWDLDAEVNGQLRTLPGVEVEPRGGRPARLDIRLPDTRFHGKVTHQGKPVAGASLQGYGQEPGSLARFDASTASDGTFDLQGVAAGSYGVKARSAALRAVSPQLVFDIRENADPSPVEIEIEGLIRIEGQVLASGAPAPNAGIGLYLRARQGDDSRAGQSDATGTVELLVPESTREATLLVAAPGFAWQMIALRPGMADARFQPFVVEVGQNGGTLRLSGPALRGAWLATAEGRVPLHLVKDTLRSSGYAQDLGNSWLLEKAAPGTYQLCGKNICVEGVLTANGTLDLDLDSTENEYGSLKGIASSRER